MGANDFHDLEFVFEVAEEDHIGAEREAAQIGAKLRPGPAENAGQRGKLRALRFDAFNE